MILALFFFVLWNFRGYFKTCSINMGKRKVTISSELFVIFCALSPIQFWLVCCFYEINDVLWDKKLLKRISAAPNITFISPKQVIVQGDKVTLICQADGRPSPTIFRGSGCLMGTRSSRPSGLLGNTIIENACASPAMGWSLLTQLLPPWMFSVSLDAL